MRDYIDKINQHSKKQDRFRHQLFYFLTAMMIRVAQASQCRVVNLLALKMQDHLMMNVDMIYRWGLYPERLRTC